MADRANITLEGDKDGIRIAFRNFEGREDVYNRKGDRNFAIIFENPEVAQNLVDQGFNIKYLKPREEGDEPTPYLPVAVSYKVRPPKIALVTSKSLTYVNESEVELLDWVDIETADVSITPSEWVVNGKSGIKAYLNSMYIKIVEDYLDQKWTAYVEDNKALEASSKRLELEAAPDYVDGEYELI
jgi:hypothetical protein